MREFVGDGSGAVIKVCDRDFVMDTIRQPTYEMAQQDLLEWIDMDIDDECMDMDNDGRFVKTDEHAQALILDISKADSIEDFKQYSSEIQMKYIIEAIHHGVSIRQASRMSIFSYAKIRKDFKIDVLSKNMISDQQHASNDTPDSTNEKNQGVRPLDSSRLSKSENDGGETNDSIMEDYYLSLNAMLRDKSPEEKIIELIKLDNTMSLNNIAKAAELSVYSCRKLIQLLERQHVIQRQGTGRNLTRQVIR